MKKSREGVRGRILQTDLRISGKTVKEWLIKKNFPSHSLPPREKRVLGGKADFERSSGRRNIIRVASASWSQITLKM